jgi:hypothetical protein
MQSRKVFFRSGLLITILSSLAVSVANAALVSADWKVAGDNLITRDDSGLEWLDLTQSTNRSYNDVSAQFGVNEDFDGWRYASRAEVRQLWSQAGGTVPYNGYTTGHVDWIAGILSLWGVTNTFPGQFMQSTAVTGDAYNSTTHHMVSLIDFSLLALPDDYALVSGSFIANVSNSALSPARAHALVRQSVVPVPAAVWLFGTALIGLVGFGKRGKAA